MDLVATRRVEKILRKPTMFPCFRDWSELALGCVLNADGNRHEERKPDVARLFRALQIRRALKRTEGSKRSYRELKKK